MGLKDCNLNALTYLGYLFLWWKMGSGLKDCNLNALTYLGYLFLGKTSQDKRDRSISQGDSLPTLPQTEKPPSAPG